MIKSALQSSLTNDIKYRSMSAGAVPSSEYLIQTYEVGATPLASITFDNLAQYHGVYKHLQVVAAIRTDRASATDDVTIKINAITNSYAYHFLYGNGSSALSSEDSPNKPYMRILYGAAGNTAAANVFSGIVMEILDPFSSVKSTTIRALAGTSSTGVSLNSGLTNSTAAVTDIVFDQWAGSNFLTGSRFSLYGVV